jgi:hypothetical protein
MFRRLGVLLGCLFVTGSVRADGLIYRLPEDGTFVTYSIDGKFRREGTDNPLSITLTLASVGKAEENGQPCRWIEVVMVASQGKTVYKLLVPEKHLKKGENPLAHVIRTWVKRGDNAVESVVEPERAPFLPGFLGGPLADPKPLEKQTIDNAKLGKVECDGIVGTRRLQREQLVIESKFELRLSDKSPFGVVSGDVEFAAKRNGEEAFSGNYTLTLTDHGRDAKSELPDAR